MNEIERKARELLADRIETVQGYALAAQEIRDGVALDGYSILPAALSAIITALTPPEGWVLVPVDVTQPMRDAGNKAIRMCNTEPGMGIADRAFYAWQSMLAARPEVK